MPLPPPPPPGPPPPPMAPLAPAPSPAADPKSRNLLLQSIRQGTTLKKTVTKDRSAPLISGKANGSTNGDEGNVSKTGYRGKGTVFSGSATIARSNGLAGLFAEGMPKLKPVRDSNGPQSNSLSSLTTAVPNNSSLHTNSINSNPVSVKTEIGRRTVDTKNRGPPPQPPPPPVSKPLLPTSASDSTLTAPGAHTRSHSNVSLQNGLRSSGSGKPFSKPQLAPKPPAPAPPRKPPSRTCSVRVTGSPPILPTQTGPVFPSAISADQLTLTRVPPSFHSSTDSLMTGALKQGVKMRAPPPLRPPQVRPPPPPRNPLPPPPPPSQPPPPPPPHRSANSSVLISRTAPPLPVCVGPPQPPTRISSKKNADFESRFEGMFHSVSEFPPPQAFMGVDKIYNSKTAKQQAPQPPLPATHVQLGNKMWARDNTSTC